MTHIAIAGAGFSGAVLAQELARAGCRVDVFDTRPHVAGNCPGSPVDLQYRFQLERGLIASLEITA